MVFFVLWLKVLWLSSAFGKLFRRGLPHGHCTFLIGLQTIAEGIETEAQWEMLQHMGCSFGQGYLFDKPLTACAATARIQNDARRIQEVFRDR